MGHKQEPSSMLPKLLYLFSTFNKPLVGTISDA